MKYLRIFLIGVWFIWFHIIGLIGVLILLPFLIIFSSKENWFPYFFQLMKIWSWLVLKAMGFCYKIEYEEKLNPSKQYIFCPNHVSFIDIPLAVLSLQNIPTTFVGKSQAARYPIFGYFYSRTMVLVDRGDPVSRKSVFANAKKKLDKNLSICIFPEGKIPEYKTKLHPFKNGSFSLAIERGIEIVPITFLDNKKLMPDKKYKGHPGLLRSYVHKPIKTTNYKKEDIEELKEKTYKVIYNKLYN